MNDAIQYRYNNFDSNAGGNFFFVPVWMCPKWSVQMIVRTAFTPGAIELLMSNDGVTGVAFSGAREFTAAGIQKEIDPGSDGFLYLGVRVKTPGASGEKLDFIIGGISGDKGTGILKDSIIPTKP